MFIDRRIAIAIAIAVALASVPGLAQAQSAAEKFYEGKQISLIIGSDAGNGYDVYGRIVAKAMEKYMPKGVHFIVKNMNGASGVVSTNYIMNVAEPDGLTIGLTQREAAFEPIYTPKNSQAKYDPRTIAWIGTPNQEFGMFYFTNVANVNSVEDATKKEVIMGTTGGGAAQTITIPRVINAMIGTRFKMITGYNSGGAVILAMQRGEVEGRFASGWAGIEPTQFQELIDAGKGHLGFTFSKERKPQVKNIPTLLESVKNEEYRQILEVLMAPQPFGRPLYASPKVPADRIQLLRDAFDKAVKDPGLIADATTSKFDVTPLPGKALGEELNKTYSLPQAILTKTVDMMDAAAVAQ
jgi:tripartite-type tricarboxylate transporter receptor subunit TctC